MRSSVCSCWFGGAAESGVALTRSESASAKEPKRTKVAPREELRQRDESEALARGSGVRQMEDKVAQDHGKRSWNAASAREAGQRIRLAQGATRGVRRTSWSSAARTDRRRREGLVCLQRLVGLPSHRSPAKTSR